MKKVLLALFAVAVFASCQKNEVVDEIPQVLNEVTSIDLKSSTESLVTTEASLDDVVEAADYEIDLFTGSDVMIHQLSAIQMKTAESKNWKKKYLERYMYRKCPDIHILKEDGGYPVTVTLNYGDSTELENGRVISGVIEVVISGPRRMNGSTKTVSFLDFGIDSIGIDGTSIKTYLKDSATVEVERELVFTLADGTTINRTSERSKTWVDGLDTPTDHSDDLIEITGFVQVSDSDGNEYMRTITDPLIKKGGCRYIVAGVVTLSKNGVDFATLDYGDMECDNIAVMTTEEGSKEIEIGKCVRKARKNTKNDKK